MERKNPIARSEIYVFNKTLAFEFFYLSLRLNYSVNPKEKNTMKPSKQEKFPVQSNTLVQSPAADKPPTKCGSAHFFSERRRKFAQSMYWLMAISCQETQHNRPCEARKRESSACRRASGNHVRCNILESQNDVFCYKDCYLNFYKFKYKRNSLISTSICLIYFTVRRRSFQLWQNDFSQCESDMERDLR